MDVNVSQLTERLKGMFIRQIGVLLGVLDSDIIVQKIQPYTEQRQVGNELGEKGKTNTSPHPLGFVTELRNSVSREEWAL